MTLLTHVGLFTSQSTEILGVEEIQTFSLSSYMYRLANVPLIIVLFHFFHLGHHDNYQGEFLGMILNTI